MSCVKVCLFLFSLQEGLESLVASPRCRRRTRGSFGKTCEAVRVHQSCVCFLRPSCLGWGSESQCEREQRAGEKAWTGLH